MLHYNPPRILDASAIVEMFHGHPLLMGLLDLAEARQVILGMPGTAIAEANAVMDVDPAMWHHFLRFPGLVDLPLTAHTALDVGVLARPLPIGGALTSRLQIGHVLHEAYSMQAVIVTGVPHVYAGHPDLVVHPLDLPPGDVPGLPG